jgi:hypothetical protein
MNLGNPIWKDLLFLHGHVADPQLAASLARDDTPPSPPRSTGASPMNLFKSLLYLGGLESIDLRIGEEEEAFGRTYGNRLASDRTFGRRKDAAPTDASLDHAAPCH